MQQASYYRRDGADVILQCKVRAGARTFAWTKSKGAYIGINVPAAPEKGRATALLLRLLAEEFGVPTAHVEIIRGAFAPLKVIRIRAPQKWPPAMR